jgi:hypothetical protein
MKGMSPMNIEEMIYNGASEEEIAAALRAIYTEKARQEEALREAEKAQSKHKEVLLKEGRACLINAILAYGEAFDLIPADYEVTEEELAECEELLIQTEKVLPWYIKISGIDKKIKAMFSEESGDKGEEPDWEEYFKGFFET